MRKVTLTKESTRDILENLLKRSPNNYGKFESAVAEILEKVKSEGDEALFTYTKQFDKVEINKDTIRVTEEEIKEAYDTIDPSLLDVIRKALVNIRTYHEKQIQNSWFTSTTNGTMLGQKVTPLNRVGVYVPGGKAVYPSSGTVEHALAIPMRRGVFGIPRAQRLFVELRRGGLLSGLRDGDRAPHDRFSRDGG